MSTGIRHFQIALATFVRFLCRKSCLLAGFLFGDLIKPPITKHNRHSYPLGSATTSEDPRGSANSFPHNAILSDASSNVYGVRWGLCDPVTRRQRNLIGAAMRGLTCPMTRVTGTSLLSR